MYLLSLTTFSKIFMKQTSLEDKASVCLLSIVQTHFSKQVKQKQSLPLVQTHRAGLLSVLRLVGFFSFFCTMLEVHCDIYKSSYNNEVYHSWIHSPHHSPLSPISGIVSTDTIFPLTYMCTQYLHHIHPLTTFPLLPFSHWYQPPPPTNSQDLFHPPVL
jgi:hypothetical protein